MKKTSIIVVSYDTTRLQRWITSACLGNIARYTNRDEYELIYVEQRGLNYDLNRRHHCIDINKHIVIEGNLGASAASNRGAKEATGDYLCFLHNDVLVWEGWLPALRKVLDTGNVGIVYPHQGPSPREQILEFYNAENPSGNNDAGLTMMTREAFERTGGWDERFKTIYMDLAFRRRFQDAVFTTAKCLITHICCGTLWAWTEGEEQAAYQAEGPIIN